MNKLPTRMCFICRNTFNKQSLNRLVKTSCGEIFLDKSGKANGRGAYICKSPECIEKLKKQKVLNRAFKCELSEEIYRKICEELIDKQN